MNDLTRDNLANSSISQISLLDCSCGIGTQAIGLAKRGYMVTATDLSPASIQRAKRESESRGTKINFGVADFRTLKSDVPGEFDVVLSADNAIVLFCGFCAALLLSGLAFVWHHDSSKIVYYDYKRTVIFSGVHT